MHSLQPIAIDKLDQNLKKRFCPQSPTSSGMPHIVVTIFGHGTKAFQGSHNCSEQIIHLSGMTLQPLGEMTACWISLHSRCTKRRSCRRTLKTRPKKQNTKIRWSDQTWTFAMSRKPCNSRMDTIIEQKRLDDHFK